MKVQLFIPCTVDQFLPDLGFKLIRVLERVGCQVQYESRQTCCGKFFFQAGRPEMTEKLAAKVVDCFFLGGPVVCPGTSCVQYLIEKLYQAAPNTIIRPQAKKIAENVYDLSQFLVETMKASDLGSEFAAKAVFIDDLSIAGRHLERPEPLKLLAAVRNLELSILPPPFRTYHLDPFFALHNEEEIYERDMRYLNAILKLDGVRKIIFSEPEHNLHFNALLEREKIDLETLHILDVLAS